jgi:hypothetical protein
MTRQRLAHEDVVDAVLRDRMAGAAFGDGNQPCGGIDERHDRVIDKAIMHDNVRARNQPNRFNGQKFGVTGASAHQIYACLFHLAFMGKCAARIKSG